MEQDETNSCDPDQLLTSKEAASMLRISDSTLRDWRIGRGQGPKFVKIGRTVRYRRQDLREFIADRTFENTAEAKS